MTTELATMTEAAFKAMAEGGKLQEMVNAQVTACVKTAIQECTGYGSEFSKALKKYVAEALPMNFERVGLAEYNGEVIKMIRAKLDGNLADWIEKTMAEQMSELLEPPPVEMKLSELVAICEREVGDGERDVNVMVEVEHSGSCEGYWSVKLGERSDQYRIAVTSEGEVYSISVPYHGNVTKRLFASRMHGLGRVLWRLYACKTKLIRDGGW